MQRHLLRRTASALALAAALGLAAQASAQPAPNGAAEAPMARPMLEKAELVTPPRPFFCTEREKLDFLLEVFYPAASRATKNNIKAHDYLVWLRGKRDAATGADRAVYEADYKEWEPIWREWDQRASAFLKLLDQIHAMPVVDCRPLGLAPIKYQVAVAAPAPRPAGAMLGALEGARAGKPDYAVGVGSYADFGQGVARPFDGREGEVALRDRLKLAGEYHRPRQDDAPPVTGWKPTLTYAPGGDGMTAVDPPTWTGKLTWPPTDGMTSLEPPLPTPVDIDLGGDTLTGPGQDTVAGPADDVWPAPAQPGYLTVDPPPPAISAAPAYPPCPTDGMPASPEHIRQFHG